MQFGVTRFKKILRESYSDLELYGDESKNLIKYLAKRARDVDNAGKSAYYSEDDLQQLAGDVGVSGDSILNTPGMSSTEEGFYCTSIGDIYRHVMNLITDNPLDLRRAIPEDPSILIEKSLLKEMGWRDTLNADNDTTDTYYRWMIYYHADANTMTINKETYDDLDLIDETLTAEYSRVSLQPEDIEDMAREFRGDFDMGDEVTYQIKLIPEDPVPALDAVIRHKRIK